MKQFSEAKLCGFSCTCRSKWLAEQLGKDRATVSKWVTNTMQPDARNLLRIAEALNIDAGRLLNQKHLNNEGNRYYPTDKTWRGQ